MKGEGKMKPVCESVNINGVTYVRADKEPAKARDGMEYCIVRTYSAGVFAGYLESRTGQEVVLRDARRLWYWLGAASLSQLASDGVSKPEGCKFPTAVNRITLLQAIEIIPCTKKAQESIAAVWTWKA